MSAGGAAPQAAASSTGDAAGTDVLDSGAAAGLVIRGGAARTIGHIAGLALGLLAVPFMIRHLGPTRYGYFITVTSIFLLVQGLTDAGLTNLAVRDYAVTSGARQETLLRNIVALRWMLSGVGMAVAVGVLAATGARGAIVAGTAILGLALVLSMTQATYAVALTARLRLVSVTLLELLRQATLTVALLVLVALNAGLLGFFWAYVLAAAVATVATVVVLSREGVPRPMVDLPTWKALLRETLPFGLTATIGFLYMRVAVILMSYIAGGRETGYYSVAFRIVEVLVVVPGVLVASAFPVLARAARDDMRRLSNAIQRMFEISTILGAGMALAVGVLAPFAIAVAAGPGYGPSVAVLRLLAVALFTGFLVESWVFALLVLRQYRRLVLSSLLAVVVAVAGTLALVPPLGARGAAIATVAADASLALICLVLLRVTPGMAPRLGVVPKVVLAVAVALIPALTLSAHPLLLAVVSTLCYFAVLLALRAIPAEAVQAFRERW